LARVHLGSVRLVVDATTGAVAQRIDYDPFGNPIYVIGAPDFQPFGFAGGIQDPDTGLVRFGARDQDPATGRWTTKDPIRFAGGDANLYAYASNDPVNLVDETGEVAHIVGGVAGGALVGGLVGGSVSLTRAFIIQSTQGDIRAGQLFAAAGLGFLTGAAAGGLAGGVLAAGQFGAFVPAARAVGIGQGTLFSVGFGAAVRSPTVPGALGALVSSIFGLPQPAQGATNTQCAPAGPPGGNNLAGQFLGGFGSLNRR
jgi:RHS repeat-associated protein